MTRRPAGAARTHWTSLSGAILLAALHCACGPAAPSEPAPPPPAESASSPPAASSAPEPVRPFALRPTLCVTASRSPIAFIGRGADNARDVVRSRKDFGGRTPLVVVADAEVGDLDALRAHVHAGALVFVDGWNGEPERLLRLVPGGALRALRADEPPLAGPHALPRVPPAHDHAARAGDERIVVVETDGCVRLLATAQDTLCHSCSCDAMVGRRAFAENLVAYADELAEQRKPKSVAPAVVLRTTLRGTRLAAGADFRAPDKCKAEARLEVLSLTGDVLARSDRALDPGTHASLDAAANVRAPFEVHDHRIVATLTTEAAVLRDVRPLADLVGAPDLRVVGSDALLAGGPGTVRLVVRNSLRGEPIAGAALALRLLDEAETELARAEGVSDSQGTAALVLDVPSGAPAQARLVAEVRTELTADRIELPVAIGARRAAHVFCDLPIHAPGEEVRARALVVEQPSGRPAAGREIALEIVRGPEEVCARATGTTDSFGVVSATLLLPETMPPSDCVVRVVEQRRTIGSVALRVERFETPTFLVAIAPERPRWTQDGTLPVRIACTRFDGRPLPGAAVSVELRSTGRDSSPARFAWEGYADAHGVAAVDVVAPRGSEDLRLVVAARDAGGREVRSNVLVPAAQPARAREFTLLAPDGPLAPGRPSRVLVQAPSHAGSSVSVVGEDGVVRAHLVDALGLAEVTVADPQPGRLLRIGDISCALPVAARPIALSLASRVVPQGGTLRFRVAASGFVAVYVDVLLDGAIIATHAETVVDGRAEGELHLPPGVAGAVAVHAYALEPGSDAILRDDARAALVVPQEELRATVAVARRDVRPGDSVEIDVRVTDSTGTGLESALAVRAADEAVLSLATAEPECTRMALVLDESVRRAGRRLGGLSATQIASRAATRDLTPEETRVADALFALLDRAVVYRLDANTLPARVAAHLRRVARQFDAFADGLTPRLRDALRGPLAPTPSEQITDVASALHASETAGAFGREGLLDPWGSPLSFEDGVVQLVACSMGPDAQPGTADDCSHAWDEKETRALVTAWLRTHGTAADVAAFVSRRAGRGGFGVGGLGGGGAGGSMAARSGERSTSARTPVRMRRFFPTALLWEPSLRTGRDGRARLAVRAPDSLTTWRVDVVASDACGRAADASASFVTSQPFAVELDPPPVLVVGDEVEVPVVVRTSLRGPVTTQASIEVSAEGKLVSSPTVAVALAGPGEGAGSVRLRAVQPGVLTIRARASAGGEADAVERAVRVVHAGREVMRSAGFAAAGGSARATLARVASALPGTARAEARIAASPIAAVLDGVEALLRQPHGCFEQTSSALYPDVLALLYLQRTGRASPEVEARFQEAIDSGMERLLGFEIEGGGFDWFGRAPAKPLLTAYGLHEWVDLAALRPSARDVARRTAAWLVSTQREDGSFPLTDAPYQWSKDERGITAGTAYVAWALARAGGHEEAVARALDLVRPRIATETDPYALALALAAFLERDPDDADALLTARRLASMAVRDAGAMRFEALSGGALHARGGGARVEATAVAALAALRLARDDVLPVRPLLEALSRDRRGDGTWGTCHATVLALRAQLAADPARVSAAASLRLRLGTRERVVEIPSAQRDLATVVDVSDLVPRSGPISIELVATDGVAASLALREVVPFTTPNPPAAPLRISVSPDRTTCALSESVNLTLQVAAPGAAPVAMPLVRLPLPAGFVADALSLDALRAQPNVERVESDAREVVVYLRELRASAPLMSAITIRPRLRGRVTMVPASAAPYYEPESTSFAAAATLTVR